MNDKKENKEQDFAWIEEIDFNEPMFSPKQKEKVIALFKQVSHVFSKSHSNFGLTDVIQYMMDSIDKIPIRYPDRAIPHHLLKEVQGVIHILPSDLSM